MVVDYFVLATDSPHSSCHCILDPNMPFHSVMSALNIAGLPRRYAMSHTTFPLISVID